MCKITKENDSLQRQTENKDEDSHVPPIKKNVPELRFPEFEGEWKEVQIKDIANIVGGGTPSTKNKDFWNGKINWFTPTEVGENKYLFNSERKITEKGLEKSSATLLPINTILLTTRATIGRRSIILKKSTTNQGFQSLTIKNNSNVEFIYYLLDTLEKILLRKSCGSTFLELSKKELKKINIIIPIIEEQEKIANFLSAIDKKIGFMEKKHTLYQNIKKYYSHVLFSNTSDWNKKNLKDIAIIKMGFTPSTKKEEYWNGNIKWLAVSDMGSKYISKTKKHITKIAIGKKEIIKKDTLVMSFKLTIGKLGILKEDMYSNEAICNFQWKNKNINTEFMYYYLSSINLKKYGSQAAKGITLNKETLNMIPIRIPSYETQINIVNILSNIDIKLEYLSKKINYEKRYKKGLLQKMFV